jgi:hypothetical protein
MSYNPYKTARKASPPLIIIILVRAVIEAARQAGIEIDENAVWEIAGAGYAGLIALINWIKNHKKGKESSA